MRKSGSAPGRLSQREGRWHWTDYGDETENMEDRAARDAIVSGSP